MAVRSWVVRGCRGMSISSPFNPCGPLSTGVNTLANNVYTNRSSSSKQIFTECIQKQAIPHQSRDVLVDTSTSRVSNQSAGRRQKAVSQRSSSCGRWQPGDFRRGHVTLASIGGSESSGNDSSVAVSEPAVSPSARTVTKVAPTSGKGSQMIDLNPPRGTRDFAPEDMRLRSWLFANFREVSRLFGFEEVDYPVMESEELFIRKAGEEITQQLYNFEDKGGRRMALRPELTPSLARLVLQKGKGLPPPVKWFAIGQCWRYERMTRGRRREHYQWNMDILGVPGVEAEAELLSAIVTFFSRLGLTSQDVGIRVSNRKVLQTLLKRNEVPEELFAPVCVLVDKIEKVPRAEVEAELLQLGVTSGAVNGILDALAVRSLDELQSALGEEVEAVDELRQLFRLAEAYGCAAWLQFDASVVRGLAYYTGTVFEAFDRQGQLRAICGGGRYDRLLSTFGGADMPACGFGFGDAVIVELLKERGLLPQLGPAVDDMVLALDEELRGQATGLAARLRGRGRAVDLVLDSGKRLKWAFKQAERVGAKRMILVGAEEWKRGTVKVKDLATREEVEISTEELVGNSL
eukprot:TRINITY_DN23590_c0_g1_i1.p1 TRINITY_DN23590_c0_g1~~TRINITY_DN23590_c0_g1_i1.p1  ORF type:complete len:576 (+),score=107.73 TRINITY_DN23590_c0_g1_i1:50-1777(+)